MSKPEVLTLAEALAFLRVSKPTLVKLAKAGELPHRKVGAHYRFLRSELEGYLRGNQTKKAG